IDGSYSIDVPGPETILVYSFIGFGSESRRVGDTGTINVTLSPETGDLDEFIVTAFGISQEKKSLAYAAQGIDSEQNFIEAEVALASDPKRAYAAPYRNRSTYGHAGSA
ncbi:MAG: SusC/RagA family TonB-linked outer membrane protein, partial [Cyclobacteriaceae bacterium]